MDGGQQLRVTRSKYPTSEKYKTQTYYDSHVLSIHFGRFKIFAVLREVELGKKRELREEMPTDLYFSKQGAKSYRISCMRSQNFGSECVYFNPFFDGKIGPIFIGDNNNQFEVNLAEAIRSYCYYIVKKLLTLDYPYLDVVYSCYRDDKTLISACGKCLKETLSKSQHVSVYNIIYNDISLYNPKNCIARVCVGEEYSYVNENIVPCGSGVMLEYIHAQAKKYFGTTLYDSIVRQLLEENEYLHNYSSQLPLMCIISHERVLDLKRKRTYFGFTAHKLHSTPFYVKNHGIDQLQLVISPKLVYDAQSYMMKSILKEARIAPSDATGEGGSIYKNLAQPAIFVSEKNNEFILSHVIKDSVEKFYYFQITAVVANGNTSSVINFDNPQITRTQVVVDLATGRRCMEPQCCSQYVGSQQNYVSANDSYYNRFYAYINLYYGLPDIASSKTAQTYQPMISSEVQMPIFVSHFSDQYLSQSSINRQDSSGNHTREPSARDTHVMTNGRVCAPDYPQSSITFKYDKVGYNYSEYYVYSEKEEIAKLFSPTRTQYGKIEGTRSICRKYYGEMESQSVNAVQFVQDYPQINSYTEGSSGEASPPNIFDSQIDNLAKTLY